jgi:hypothetical protein
MRLKLAAVSATGRTRCGEFVDQKDEPKPIVLVIKDQKLLAENGRAKVSLLLFFSLHLPWCAGLSRPSRGEDGSFVRRRLTFLDAAFHAALK